ncbi:MAG: DEAD/DEAH box helicase [Candidatus Pacearchaeota archaeon]
MEILKNISPREYQKEIFETCKEKNCLVVIPTGLGKTLIALMLTIDRMSKFPGEKVVFLAPTKPLAEQHLIYFKKNLPELYGEMQLFTGSVNAKSRQKIWQTADIIFSTPQCVANDLKKGLYSLEEVCLLIEDEAHRCVRNYDYNYTAKKYMEQAINPRILGLTASPGSEVSKIKEICKNLSIEEVELRTRDSPDVNQYIQELKFEKILVDLPPEFQKIRSALQKLFDGHISELRNRKVLWGMPSKSELIKLQKKIMFDISRKNRDYNLMLASSACATAIKIQHALELLETQTLYGFNKYLKEIFRQAAKKENKSSTKLVSKPEFNYSFINSNELIGKNIEHPKVLRISEIIKEEKANDKDMKIIIFTQFRDTAHLISDNLNEIEGINSKVFIGQAKKSTSSGKLSGLSQKEQKKIIDEFSGKEINVLCATSIGEEGLDIPEVNTVIFYEPVPSAIRAIQRTGRTARLKEGKLIMIITKGTRDEAHFYVSKAKEKKMHNAIDSIKKTLSNKLPGKIKNDVQKKIGE